MPHDAFASFGPQDAAARLGVSFLPQKGEEVGATRPLALSVATTTPW